MELIAPYNEINAYIKNRFKQPVSVSYAEEGQLKVSYTKHILIKDMSVNIYLQIEEVTADTVLVRYHGAMDLDMIIRGALSFISSHFPQLAAGIHPEENHRIRLCLSEIKQAKDITSNIVLKAILPSEQSIKIEFSLKP